MPAATGAKQPVKNEDLWRALDSQAAKHRVKWHWLKGHAGHALNERADALAREAIAAVRAGAAGALSAQPVRGKPLLAAKKARSGIAD